ncbi:extracellular calcium-sensing receptor-like [Pleurodeles waltl]|uniref:extracellular calcium-sensing receptor-like n=1 Tax=Pleurodeles waltl TaxID=8319 RepID=UPI003709B94F
MSFSRCLKHCLGLFWVLVSWWSEAQDALPQCHLQGTSVGGFSRDGDILIGGIFPIHGGSLHKAFTFTEEPAQQMRCEKLISDYYQWFQVMVFAIEEINNNSELLPNITLGFRIYDSCMMIQHAIKGTLWMLTGLEEPIPNYQCSRTNPPATIIGEMTSSISVVMARILGLYQHPQISYSASSSLLSDRNQFPSFFRTMPSDDFQAQGLVQLLIHFGWTWIGLLAEDSDYGQQGAHIVQEELTRAGACVAFFETIRTNRVKSNTFHIAWVIKNSTANVVLIFSTDYIMIPLLDELVQQRVTGKTWVSTDGWTTSRLLSHEKYSEILSGTLGFDVNSGYVHSLGEYFTKINPLVPLSVCSPSCPMGFRKAAIQGKPICCFQCVLCPQGEVSNQTDSVECFKCPWDHWPNEKQDKCRLKTIEFLSYDEPLGTTLTTCSILFSVLPLSILAIFINCRNTPIVRANNRSVSYLLLLSLTLCFLSSLNFIGHPTKEKCLIRQAAFGIIFALCVSCILAKTIMVVIAFNATKPNSDLRRWVRPQLSYMVITVCTLTQVLLCASWLIMSPPFPEYDVHTQSGTVIAECNDGSQIAFWFMLGYLGLLATISFIVAFLARKLPDSFNEARFITFSMLAFLSVWLSFIPAYLSTRGKYMVAMEVFAILASSFGLVSCIFFPKCYIILLRSEMNTKGYLMGRGASLTKKVKHI